MGLLISINGANFEPYQRVARENPLIKDLRSVDRVRPLKSHSDSPQDFDEAMKDSMQRGIQKYTDVAHETEKVSRVVVTAKELMSFPVITLFEDQEVQDARDLFERHDIRHLPVISRQEKLIGILSDRDLALKKVDKFVRQIMIKEVIAGQADTRLQEIARAMVLHRIHSVPILDESHKLIGIVTATDLLESVFKNPNVDLFA